MSRRCGRRGAGASAARLSACGAVSVAQTGRATHLGFPASARPAELPFEEARASGSPRAVACACVRSARPAGSAARPRGACAARAVARSAAPAKGGKRVRGGADSAGRVMGRSRSHRRGDPPRARARHGAWPLARAAPARRSPRAAQAPALRPLDKARGEGSARAGLRGRHRPQRTPEEAQGNRPTATSADSCQEPRGRRLPAPPSEVRPACGSARLRRSVWRDHDARGSRDDVSGRAE